MPSIIDFHNPLLWAIVIGWILSVVLHEFAHGIVAYWGGDYTIRERGGLTLNPLQYIDPFFSLALPLIFLMMGGVPLPGGATYIRRDLLRSKLWSSAVSLAGPAMNLLIFLLLCALLRRPGWIDYNIPVREWTIGQQFAAAMAYLQLFAVLLNLLPVPPLDGFQTIAPYLPERVRVTLMTPPWSTLLILMLFMMISRYGPFQVGMVRCIAKLMNALGVDPGSAMEAFDELFRRSG
jgi:Zn-dependent protease